MNIQQLAKDFLVYKCLAGSHAYGTNIETSDIDTRGIFIAPPEVSLGCMYTVEQVLDEKQDEQIYELKKFTRLAAECNPNIIELLATDEKNIQYIHPIFQNYREQANLFLSKKAKHTFSGYAFSQLKRIKGHNKWINNPQPEKEPTLSQFIRWVDEKGYDINPSDKQVWLEEFSQRHLLTKINEHTYKVYQVNDDNVFRSGIVASNEQQMKYIDIELSKIIAAIHENILQYAGTLFVHIEDFKHAHDTWHQYWAWKRERNPQRAALEEKYLYDSKHASHLIRLYRMGEEILTEGKVKVFREDAEELKAIRNGAWTYEEIIKWVADQDEKLNKLYETSSLPHSPDIKAINQLYINTIMTYWKEKKLL